MDTKAIYTLTVEINGKYSHSRLMGVDYFFCFNDKTFSIYLADKNPDKRITIPPFVDVDRTNHLQPTNILVFLSPVNVSFTLFCVDIIQKSTMHRFHTNARSYFTLPSVH